MVQWLRISLPMQGTWVSFLLWEDSTCGRATKAHERKVEVLAGQLCGTLCNLMITLLVKNPPVMQETPVQFLGREDPLEKREATHSSTLGLPFGSASKESTCNVGDLDSIPGEDPLEKEKATYCSILAWRIPWMYSPHGGKESVRTELLSLFLTLQSHGLYPVRFSVHGILQVRILKWVANSLLQGLFSTQGLNHSLLYRRQILYHLSH